MRNILEQINLTKELVEKYPNSREKALIITKLDEARLWTLEYIKNNNL